MKQLVLVTGGQGLFGKNLATRLLAQGLKVASAWRRSKTEVKKSGKLDLVSNSGVPIEPGSFWIRKVA